VGVVLVEIIDGDISILCGCELTYSKELCRFIFKIIHSPWKTAVLKGAGTDDDGSTTSQLTGKEIPE